MRRPGCGIQRDRRGAETVAIAHAEGRHRNRRRAIAQQIVEQEGDYAPAPKGYHLAPLPLIA